MKRIILACVAAVWMGGMAMAQNERGKGETPDTKVRVERMTERMAKEYNLDDKQAKQLLEANQTLIEIVGEMPPARPRFERQHRPRRYASRGCCGCPEAPYCDEPRFEQKRGDRPQLTDEQRAELKAQREKRQEEMKAARMEYNKRLREILTEEQFEEYLYRLQTRR